MANSYDFDPDHMAVRAWTAMGYPLDSLTAPAYVPAEEVEAEEWRALVYTNHGGLAFDATGIDRNGRWPEDGWPMATYSHKGGSKIPVDYADHEDGDYPGLPSESHHRGGVGSTATVFVRRDTERDYPTLTTTEAVELLDLWGSEGYFPVQTGGLLVEACDGSFSDGPAFADDDIGGERIIRSVFVAEQMARGLCGESGSSDDGISGHKKRRRQRYYRSRDLLRERVGLETDD